MPSENEILMYKDRPLVRDGNIIYYGYQDLPYVIVLQINSEKEINGEKFADSVSVKLYSDKVDKEADRKGLYSALELGSIWLDKALRK